MVEQGRAVPRSLHGSSWKKNISPWISTTGWFSGSGDLVKSSSYGGSTSAPLGVLPYSSSQLLSPTPNNTITTANTAIKEILIQKLKRVIAIFMAATLTPSTRSVSSLQPPEKSIHQSHHFITEV